MKVENKQRETLSVEEAASKKYLLVDDNDGDYALLSTSDADETGYMWTHLNMPTMGVWDGPFESKEEAIKKMFEDGYSVQAFDTWKEVSDYLEGQL